MIKISKYYPIKFYYLNYLNLYLVKIKKVKNLLKHFKNNFLTKYSFKQLSFLLIIILFKYNNETPSKIFLKLDSNYSFSIISSY